MMKELHHLATAFLIKEAIAFVLLFYQKTAIKNLQNRKNR